MLDYNSLWDENDEDARIYEKFTQYYGDFSNDVREGLLKKNVDNPTSVYDVLYPSTREHQLTKNIPLRSDLLKDSEVFRRQALSKIIGDLSDIEITARDYRKAMLAKNGMSESDILSSSVTYRKQQLSKNTDEAPEVDYEEHRKQQLSKNVPSSNNIDQVNEQQREDQLSKNVPTDRVDQSDVYRDTQLSKNVSSSSDVGEKSVAFREDQLSRNISGKSDIEQDGNTFRAQQLSKNTEFPNDIEASSEPLREDQLSKNVPSEINNEKISDEARHAQLSKNTPAGSDIEKDSEVVRKENTSKNIGNGTDIEKASETLRADQLAKNVAGETDIEISSLPFRDGQIAKNVAVETDLEKSSETFRDNQLSSNTPKTSDLEQDSVVFREAGLSANVPAETSIEDSSVPFRENNLSNNVPGSSNIEDDSVPFRESNLSNNVPGSSDIEADSVPFREENLSANVPGSSDIETDSVPFREENLSANVPGSSDIETNSVPFREENLSANVPGSSDIETDSVDYRTGNLNANVPGESDIENDSVEYRESQLSANVPGGSDIITDSIPYRTEQMAANNFEGSSIAESSVAYRADSLARNVPAGGGNIAANSLVYREVQLARNSPGAFGVNIEGFGTQAFIGVSRNYAFGILAREILLSRNVRTKRNPYVDGQEGKLKSGEYTGFYGNTVKEAIVEQHLKNGQESIGYTKWTSSDPTATRLGSQVIDALGSDDLMAKTVAGNPLESSFPGSVPLGSEFIPKGKTILDTVNKIIAKGGIGKNLERGQTEFIIGNGRTSTQRFTIKNPYNTSANAGKAGKIIFSITNYAIENNGQLSTMYFPPYIQNFSESESANWNAIQFLGRPEPIYTYNNSTRDGSLSFYVLTDFSQELLASYDQDGHRFTERDSVEEQLKQELEKLITNKQQVEDRITEVSVSEADTQNDIALELVEGLKGQIPKLSKEVEDMKNRMFNPIDESGFDENKDGRNIYSSLVTQIGTATGFEEYNLQSANQYIEELIRGLAMQPAYFSGDKVDFRRRMSFLSKLTRPRANTGSDRGFSFTTPPVAHLRLGDWIDHDVIIDNVSKDYSDVTWCLEDGEVQPMWAVVSIKFNVIGPYGTYKNVNEYRPLTATDVGGYYSRRDVW